MIGAMCKHAGQFELAVQLQAPWVEPLAADSKRTRRKSQ